MRLDDAAIADGGRRAHRRLDRIFEPAAQEVVETIAAGRFAIGGETELSQLVDDCEPRFPVDRSPAARTGRRIGRKREYRDPHARQLFVDRAFAFRPALTGHRCSAPRLFGDYRARTRNFYDSEPTLGALRILQSHTIGDVTRRSANSYWNSPTAVSRLAGSTQNIVVDPWGSEFVGSDLASGSLPEVTFITPCPYDSDHPNSISNTGPLWVAWLINQIGQAQNQAFQNNTAIVLTWDDWGAWYDHVGAPHPLPNIYGVNPDANEWGFRVPMIVISAYPNSQGYVSHTLRSSSSILDFIEWNFGAPVGGLHADDYDSAYAANQNSPDYLQDMFEPNLTVNPVPHPWPTIEPSNYSPTYGAKKQPICPPEKYF